MAVRSIAWLGVGVAGKNAPGCFFIVLMDAYLHFIRSPQLCRAATKPNGALPSDTEPNTRTLEASNEPPRV